LILQKHKGGPDGRTALGCFLPMPTEISLNIPQCCASMVTSTGVLVKGVDRFLYTPARPRARAQLQDVCHTRMVDMVLILHTKFFRGGRCNGWV
jgi:hypothetical protein